LYIRPPKAGGYTGKLFFFKFQLLLVL